MDGVDEEFRIRLRAVLERCGRSMRGLSAAMGRDPGYIAALLDPTRPSRARPTPADLLRASDVTGIPLVELLDRLWGIEPVRLVDELTALGVGGSRDRRLARLSAVERAAVSDFIDFLGSRHIGRSGSRPVPRRGMPTISAGAAKRPADQNPQLAALSPPVAESEAATATTDTSGRVFLGAYRPPSSLQTMSDADLDAWAASVADAMAARLRARASDASGHAPSSADRRSRRRRPDPG